MSVASRLFIADPRVDRRRWIWLSVYPILECAAAPTRQAIPTDQPRSVPSFTSHPVRGSLHPRTKLPPNCSLMQNWPMPACHFLLRDMPPSDNETGETIHIPRTQQFTVDALTGMMERLEVGGSP